LGWVDNLTKEFHDVFRAPIRFAHRRRNDTDERETEMTTTRIVCAGILLATTMAGPQSAWSGQALQNVQHAPTFQACNADFNLWSSQMPGFPVSTTDQEQEGTRSLTVVEMVNRISYLDDCSGAYPVLNKNRTGEMSALSSLDWMYIQQIQTRYLHFLSRYGMSAKFYEEDEAGKR
jgi:hypothetical protein